jgi:uracil-DNA glycosylase family 4
MQSFKDKLRECEDCRKFGRHYEEILNFAQKASIHFNAYKICQNRNIRNLFIAEAPPWEEPKYFYNTEIEAGALRKGLFDQLKIKDYTKCGLKTFNEECFLTDTIKCRLKKTHPNPPSEVIANCAKRFLLHDIESLKPKNIVVLGNTAKKGLEQFSEFEALRKFRVKKDCGRKIRVKDYTVVLYVFPNDMNSNVMKGHPLIELLK